MDPQLNHVLATARMRWPQTRFYQGGQRETIQSVIWNKETVVVAGNQLGKDYVAGFIALDFFLCPQRYFPISYVNEIEALRRVKGRSELLPERLVHSRRVVTTSVREKHLDVLWAEIGKFIQTSEEPLLEARGGPLAVNALDIRFVEEKEVKKPHNYLIGCVSGDTGEGLAGHHAAYTLFIGDEASGLSDTAYSMAQGWAKKVLLFGNPNPAENYFRRAVRDGDIVAR